jgi:hypothetical protein
MLWLNCELDFDNHYLSWKLLFLIALVLSGVLLNAPFESSKTPDEGAILLFNCAVPKFVVLSCWNLNVHNLDRILTN